MHLRPAFAAAVLTLSAPAAAQPAPAFVGEWAGGPTTCAEPFTFTVRHYTPPGAPRLRIQSVERDGVNYLLSFADGYRVSLFDVKRRTLTWHSPISGDTFDLRRC